MMRLTYKSLAIQAFLVLLVGMAFSHMASLLLYIQERNSESFAASQEHIARHISTIYQLVKDASESERNRIVRLVDHPEFHVAVSPRSALAASANGAQDVSILRDRLKAALERSNGNSLQLRYLKFPKESYWGEHFRKEHRATVGVPLFTVSFQMADGEWLNFAAPTDPLESLLSIRFILSLSVMVALVAIISIVVISRLLRPLSRLSEAAQKLGVDPKAPPMAESGPIEIRHAAQAFNRMQSRIQQFIQDRTQMIAAISHDLGTPITRLKLRAEFMKDEEQRTKMLADLHDMERMVQSAMAFTRDHSATEPQEIVDFAALIERVCDDLIDTGHSITLKVDKKVIRYECRPIALRRALTNLIENACKYGVRAFVSMDAASDKIVVHIDDEGPGIPAAYLETVFQPFRRLESSRNPRTGGVGLGLTIARTIIRSHGGDIHLVNKDGGGLRVDVLLPLASKKS